MEEQHHVALPKLYGAPAYARPPRHIEVQARPFDPDDLPLEAFRDFGDGDHGGVATAVAPAMTEEALAPRPAPADRARPGSATEPLPASTLEARPFSIKGLARRIAGR